MNQHPKRVHPYIPNSVPAIKERMLKEVDAGSTEDFFEDVPASLRMKGEMALPQPYLSEHALRKHVEGILAGNKAADEYLNFLGAGCYQHYVPAVCDEISMRGEFLSSYSGRPYEDHGRYQALFEYTSLMGELLEMDVVSFPIYDGFQAAATSLRMAARITGRNQILLPRSINPNLFSKILDYCKPDMRINMVEVDPETGHLDLDNLRDQITENTAGVFIENPSYLGFIEVQGDEISSIAHEHGALTVVSVNPISLGVLAPPAAYGADIVCGDIQPLGMHMQYGGGHAGFIASHNQERFVMEYPTRLWGITPTKVPGEYGFGDVAFKRTSFALREEGKEWVGTGSALWGIVAAVYLSLMGPQGMCEIGENVMARARYACQALNEIDGVKTPVFNSPHFNEFTVNFDGTGKSVREINRILLKEHIFGGKDLSQDFPALGQSALLCTTEIHSQSDIDTLVNAVSKAVTR